MPPAYLKGPALPHRGGCTGKNRYESEVWARVTIEKTGASGNPYRCVFCPYWHIGRGRPSKDQVATGRARPLTASAV
jgi:hypothetical protein